MPNLAPIERFVREVLPTIPGGFQRITDSTGHLQLIAKAVEERGLTTRTVGRTRYFYDGRVPVGGMTGWVPTLIGGNAQLIGRSKSLTKQMLQAAGVPTPAGITVDRDQFDTAVAHLRSLGRPMVLKPVTGKGAAGITCDIATESDLTAAWDTAALAAGPGDPFVLEEQVEGVDIRAYVVGSRVVAAATRLHAHVVGDGRQSIAALVAAKQTLRNEHVQLAKKPIKVDSAMLARHGHALADVPAAGEIVVLNGMANQHVGGEAVDVTDRVHPDLLNLALDATLAIPGLCVGGIDLMTPSLDSADGAVVLEANIGANIRVHHTPAFGAPRDVAGAIIDEMIAIARARARA